MHKLRNDFKCPNLSDSFEKFIEYFSKTYSHMLKIPQTTHGKLEKYWKEEYEMRENGGNRGEIHKRRKLDFE